MIELFRRAGPALQWATAVAFLVAAVWVGAGIVREFSLVTGDDSAPPASVAAAVPSSVPAGAVSLPVLLFEDGKGVRVGDPATHIAALLGRAAEVGRQEIDADAGGERHTRAYEYGGRRFALVFTLAQSHADPTVTAIYLE